MQISTYENSTVPVTQADLLPSGLVTAKVLIGLANKLSKLEYWQRHHQRSIGSVEIPYLRLLRVSPEGRITALIQSGNLTLKLALRRSTGDDEWIVLGDALKVSD